MRVCRLLFAATALWAVTVLPGPAADEAKKPLPDFLKGSAADFIKRHDKNNDNLLTKDELPEFLARGFERIDRNSDGKLDTQEVEQMLTFLRQRFGNNPNPANPPAKTAEVDRFVNLTLERHDANKDGKITKQEAKDQLAENFDRVDRNQDGVLDKEELRFMAQRMLAQGGPPPGGPGAPRPPDGPDFDTLDKNADGRLTADELTGTPWAEKFDQIDANGDKKIDPKEFEAFVRKK